MLSQLRVLKALIKNSIGKIAWKKAFQKHSFLGEPSSDEELTHFEKKLGLGLQIEANKIEEEGKEQEESAS